MAFVVLFWEGIILCYKMYPVYCTICFTRCFSVLFYCGLYSTILTLVPGFALLVQ